MNKAKRMEKKLVKLGAIAAGVIVCCVGAMVVTGSMATDAEQRKSSAENARNQGSAQVSNIRSQIEKSGDAEKRFIDIALKHSSEDYSANTDVLKDWLRVMKEKYRFSDNFKLTLALDKASDRPEFSALNFDVTVREPMKLEFGAISDMHVFSFVRQLEQDMSGMVRLTKFELKRKYDMNISSFRDMAGGGVTEYVEALVEFTWIGIEPKPAAPAEGAAAPGGA